MNLGFRDFKVLIDKEKSKGNYEEVIVEPLEKGYGITLGVALRRILLDSMPGAAIIAFRIDGVNHELMSINGTSNDTLELIAALKKMRFKMEGTEDVILKLKVDKAGPYYAKDMDLPDGVKLLTPDVFIFNGNGKKKFTAEFLLRKGRSDVQANNHKDVPPEFVQIDGLFSPVQQVGYDVSPVIEGDEVSHERLTLKVTTDGSIKSREAVAIASTIAKEIFKKFDDMEEKKTEMEIFEEMERERISIDNTTIEELNLSVRSTNALKNAGIHTVGDLRKVSETQLKDFRNMGKTSVQEVKDVLKKLNVRLGDY